MDAVSSSPSSPHSAAAVAGPSNDVLLQRLRDGLAEFVFVGRPQSPPSPVSIGAFARIGASPDGALTKKPDRYSVHRISGDGRCMFRALVKGMAVNKGLPLGLTQETADADELRMAVREVICESEEERRNYEEALIAITVDEPLKQYCQRIRRSDFWGGESELLVLSKLCHQPIIVYIPAHEHMSRGRGASFIPIAEYGSDFIQTKKDGKPRKPVRLLYNGKNHYDLLI